MTKVWLVTGCSRGLGRALAEAILQAGDSLVATARNPAQLEDLVVQYGQDRVLAVVLDVTDPSSASAAIAACLAKFGRLDVLVNNAGYADVGSIEDMSLESFRAQMETNFFGVVHVTKAAVPTLRKQGHGHVIQISSVGGRVGSPGLAAYQSSKWAVGGFSTVLAAELAPLGVRVTVLEPGGMKTDWIKSMIIAPVSEPYLATVQAQVDLRAQLSADWSEPADIVKSVLHVASVPEPPLRMLLGEDAVEIGKIVADNLAASDKKWEDVARLKV
ncbi:hypothetical protein LLEC1_02679 [Akanthomyces lecanii]|uniref:Ketoreductase domain-containing protein n=1 Tax=Cordyceps confragosa TaxID=2714763 RepID=A0A179I3Z9_CORDF|nr:hypothetical protein LLEC1_02679 [Akanthomyces lecanii]